MTPFHVFRQSSSSFSNGSSSPVAPQQRPDPLSGAAGVRRQCPTPAAAAGPPTTTTKISARTLSRLRDSVESNPVTIVVGPTGSGKSTRIPPFVAWGSDKDDGIGAGRSNYHNNTVLCTQPRRLAVVAVATRVALESNNTLLGGPKVGYHVGQSKQCTDETQLVFATAGMLVEQLCRFGIQVWMKYRVIILDECHERSPESELALALLRSLLHKYATTKPIRLILMSATFDHERYRSFFAQVPGCERIDTIQLETAASFDAFHTQVQVHYLDDIFRRRILPPAVAQKHTEFRLTNPDQDLHQDNREGGKSLSHNLIHFVVDLVHHLHFNNNDDDNAGLGVFVIFAPTYRHLEQLYLALDEHRPRPSLHSSTQTQTTATTNLGTWKVSVLHSSVDMEHCLSTMKQQEPSPLSTTTRKVILASAIAESSVTIPNVRVVIDLCRSLHVEWSEEYQRWLPETKWASQSICDQRKGRTGRTCPGQVYRLVPQAFYLERLPEYETPQLALASCRDEALKLVCGGSAAIGNPMTLLCHECLDPPPESIVQQALDYLVLIGAATHNPKKRNPYHPTPAGKFMTALPFPIEDGLQILTGGRLALLHEVLVLRAILTHKPMPMVQYFGQATRNHELVTRFFPHHDRRIHTTATSTTSRVALAHLSAFFYWDCHWNGARTKAMMEQFLIGTTLGYNSEWKSLLSPEFLPFTNGQIDVRKPCCGVSKWTPELDERHIEWCAQHEINPTAVRSIADVVSNTCRVFYHSDYEPEWLRCSDPTFSWRRVVPNNNNIDHVDSSYAMLQMAYGTEKGRALIHVLTELLENPLWALDQARHFSSPSNIAPAPAAPTQFACVHFLRGRCDFGEDCRFEHSLLVPPPPCRFQGLCSKPNCLYTHNHETTTATTSTTNSRNKTLLDPLHLMDPIAPVLSQYKLICLQWFKEHKSNHIMLLGEGKFEFTKALVSLGMPPRVASDYWTTDDEDHHHHPVVGEHGLELGCTTILNVNATRLHLNTCVIQFMMNEVDRFVWMFPDTDEGDDDNANQESLILGTFLSLAHALILANQANPMCWMEGIDLGIALHADQFSQWNVLANAIQCGWKLVAWGPFSVQDFPRYTPRQRKDQQPLRLQQARFYHFTYTAKLPYEEDYDGGEDEEYF